MTMSSISIRGRYAPSPTGTLHLGNLRTALLAWLFARSAGGAYILRMEDLDGPRVRPGAAEQILADLRWLGLEWDEGPDVDGPYGPYTQSAREAIYAAALAHLRRYDAIYPCYCTRAELRALHTDENVASAPHGLSTSSPPARYCSCRVLTSAERLACETSGRRPAWRFRAPPEPFTFTDRIMGTVTQRPSDAGDFIVWRSDGLFAYHLAVVVDDALMGVSQIVRGADLLPFVAAQRALFLALGYPPPTEYAHVPLATDATGVRMAKRDASAGVAALRAHGVTPAQTLGALAASCGLWPANTPATPADLLVAFDPMRIIREPSPIVLLEG